MAPPDQGLSVYCLAMPPIPSPGMLRLSTVAPVPCTDPLCLPTMNLARLVGQTVPAHSPVAVWSTAVCLNCTAGRVDLGAQ
mmetsp:Transcript_117758/g.205040  ORF Transcript_117758/g.205040 Transcript_117758/m.205040 type:complete len:81 (+) Transcript_117758:232-474(+)